MPCNIMLPHSLQYCNMLMEGRKVHLKHKKHRSSFQGFLGRSLHLGYQIGIIISTNQATISLPCAHQYGFLSRPLFPAIFSGNFSTPIRNNPNNKYNPVIRPSHTHLQISFCHQLLAPVGKLIRTTFHPDAKVMQT